MKKLILTTMAMGLLFCLNGRAQQANTETNGPVITFQKDTIDYGTIAHNSDGYRYFNYTNTGKEPLIIADVHGSCGCTVPTASKEPLQPGQSNKLKVHYATDRVGRFVKTVTVNSNAVNASKVVVIIGNVLPDAPVSAAPAMNAGK